MNTQICHLLILRMTVVRSYTNKLIVFLFIFCVGCAQDDNDRATQDEPVINNPSQDIQMIRAENINGNLDRGRKLYLQCRACHSLKKNESHKLGPNLFGIFDQQAGTQEGFTYSLPLIESNLIWDQDNLDRWLAAPYELVPGNKMVFSGMRQEKDREDLLAYLYVETFEQ